MDRDLYGRYQEFHKMREAILDGSPGAARNAHEYYLNRPGESGDMPGRFNPVDTA